MYIKPELDLIETKLLHITSYTFALEMTKELFNIRRSPPFICTDASLKDIHCTSLQTVLNKYINKKFQTCNCSAKFW